MVPRGAIEFCVFIGSSAPLI
jgi:hypothetical protein